MQGESKRERVVEKTETLTNLKREGVALHLKPQQTTNTR